MRLLPIWEALDIIAQIIGRVFNVTVVVHSGEWETVAWFVLLGMAAVGWLQWAAGRAVVRQQTRGRRLLR